MARSFRKKKNFGSKRTMLSKKDFGTSFWFLGFRFGVRPDPIKYWSIGFLGKGLYYLKNTIRNVSFYAICATERSALTASITIWTFCSELKTLLVFLLTSLMKFSVVCYVFLSFFLSFFCCCP